MIKIINELDIRKASDIERCQIIIGIIQGKNIYKNSKTSNDRNAI